jgi:hypothetical protein
MNITIPRIIKKISVPRKKKQAVQVTTFKQNISRSMKLKNVLSWKLLETDKASVL